MKRKQLSVLLAIILAVGAVVAAAVLHHSSKSPGDNGQSPTNPNAADSQSATAERHVFHSPLAGQWYPSDAKQLEQELQGYLDNVDDQKLTHVMAIVLPHAGYTWSGQTAAYGVKQIQQGDYRRVIVIGPSHHVAMQNIASIPDATDYATPLGEAPLDTAFLASLRKYDCFKTIQPAHASEHSVQIEFPLIQMVLHDVSFVPIVVGQLDVATIRQIAKILSGLIDRNTLVVASSDFTHYGPNYRYVPFTDDVPEKLKELDMGTLEQIQRKDLNGFRTYMQQTGTTVCGRDSIGVLLAMLPSDAEVKLLHYDTSGKRGGDYTNSVSYFSIAFTGEWPEGTPVSPPKSTGTFTLTREEKKTLLHLARSTLAYALDHGRMPTVEELGIAITPAMKTVSGCFVTLHKHGQLRGCIGEILPTRPLYQAVMHQAINAGVNDPRFSPVRAAELTELDVEISVLTPPVSVASWKDIVIGKHGMILRKSGRSAVFLPQVAPEQGWDVEQTLTHLARKAGLDQDAWRDGASFSVFEAIVFGEDDE